MTLASIVECLLPVASELRTVIDDLTFQVRSGNPGRLGELIAATTLLDEIFRAYDYVNDDLV